MKTILAAIAFGLAFQVSALAADPTPHIGVQYGAPAGLFVSWAGSGGGLCGSPSDSVTGNCVFIPPGFTVGGAHVSYTIKQPPIEVLVSLVCGMGDDFETVWTSEMRNPTDNHWEGDVMTPVLDYHVVADGYRACWIMQQTQSGITTDPGSAFEVQVNLIKLR